MNEHMFANDRGRYSGVLVHPTSFPSPYGIGDFGKGAYDFIDFLEEAGQHLWQVLPLVPITDFGNSPYQSYSVYAGEPLLISPELLKKQGLLTEKDFADMPDFSPYKVDYELVRTWKFALYKKAYDNFCSSADSTLLEAYDAFCEENGFWLGDFCLFMAAKEEFGPVSWAEWPAGLRNLTAKSRERWEEKLAEGIRYQTFLQFLFYSQWYDLKKYANDRGIAIIGDIPIFVSQDSADVWANRKLFQMTKEGFPTVVSGVPPDYFSATGQKWGNPLYDWKYHKKTDYEWWISRIRHQLKQVDFLRIDHFRGFEAYWEVPADAETAMDGIWRKGPGEDLFHAIQKELGENLPIFAEDLGVITPEVEALRDQFGFPGMRVLQFAFEDEASTFLPHNFNTTNCICYTGTHDNNTTLGWYFNTTDKVRDYVRRYMNTDGSCISWDFIRTALSTVARYAIFPVQDLLNYGEDCRMNIPGVASGNWSWRFCEGDLHSDMAKGLRKLTELFGR